MVGLDLHTQGQGEKHRTEHRQGEPFSPGSLVGKSTAIGENQACKHPGSECKGLHLCVVPHLDDLEIVGTESHRNGSCNGKNLVDSQGEHQQKSPEKGHEKIVGRPESSRQKLVQRFCPVSLKLVVHRHGRHSPEDGVRPQGPVVGMGGIVGGYFICNAFPGRYVRLIQHLSRKHLRHEAVGEGEEEEDDARVDEAGGQYLVILHFRKYLIFTRYLQFTVYLQFCPSAPPFSGPWSGGRTVPYLPHRLEGSRCGTPPNSRQ